MFRRSIIFASIFTLTSSAVVLSQEYNGGSNRRVFSTASSPQIENQKLLYATLPSPKLIFVGKEKYVANGQKWIRYNLSVANRSAYPASLFAAAPQLPACGSNQNSSRTWVDIFDSQSGERIYGFCALSSPQNLDNLWFAVKKGEEPPQCVNIVMTDRLLKKTYKSNKVCFGGAIEVPDDITIGQPDLSLKYQFAPSNNKVVRVLVSNTGAVNSKACVLRLTVRKINGIPVGRTTEIVIPPIMAGQTQPFLISAQDILPINVALKDTTFRLNVDANSGVNESNESNNEVWHNL